MDINRFSNLRPYLSRALGAGNSDPEETAYAENFLWDERPPIEGHDLYARHFDSGPVADLDDWTNRHGNYTTENLRIDQDEPENPWTFQTKNEENRLRQVHPNLYLIRVERANWPCGLSGVSFEELERQVDKFKQGNPNARASLERFINVWNNKRDKRPLFATTELEVEELLNDKDHGWAERLRDQLGLGQYSPSPEGPPIEIIVMRYTVKEALDAFTGGGGYPAVPTVLDSDMSPFFFPSPKPGPEADANPYYGHAVNLAAVDNENDYEMGVELLHPRLDYRPEHIFRTGVISKPFSMPLERARSFHLPWLRLNKDREDFGDSSKFPEQP